MSNKAIQYTTLPLTKLTLISDTYDDDGKLYDTEVKIGDETLVVVSGDKAVEFGQKLQALCDEYRI